MTPHPPLRALTRLLAVIVATLNPACDPAPTADDATTSSGSIDPAAELPPVEALQSIVDELRATSGAPGAVLAVARGDRRIALAAGLSDATAGTPMRADQRFRAASIGKMFVGVVALQLVGEGVVDLDDRLDAFRPTFPHASEVTLRRLLSHTAGVTTAWLEDPTIQSTVVADLDRTFTPDEVIGLLAPFPPAGLPGEGAHYANGGFVLLADALTQRTGTSIGDLLRERVIDRLGLTGTSFQFDNPPDLAHGTFEYGSAVLDAAVVPQTAVLSFAGAAGALHATAPDLVRFVQALFEGELLPADDVKLMQTEGIAGSGLGHAMMLFCPCSSDGRHAGFGHGGQLPGYWSLVVYYPEKKLAVATMINRDTVNGQPITRAPLDRAATRVFEAVE